MKIQGLVWICLLALGAVVWGAEKKSKEPPKTVEVFKDGALPDRTFKELEVFTDDITLKEEPEITQKLVKKAQKLGADALIVHKLTRSGSEIVLFGGLRDSYAYKATAISYTGPPGSLPRPELPHLQPEPRKNGAPVLSSTGTGFFITADGFLVTNEHVIEGASQVQILFEQRLLDAAVIRTDRTTDLAVLKVAGTFKPLAIASSRAVKLGDSVLTVGFPRPGVQGLEPKLTRGDISGLSGLRDDPQQFQISTPIQPGNSGGPLVNKSGDVIGVIVAKLNPLKVLSESASLPENVNYAIKSNYLKVLLESIPKISDDMLAKPRDQERPDRDVIDATVSATIQVLSYR